MLLIKSLILNNLYERLEGFFLNLTIDSFANHKAFAKPVTLYWYISTLKQPTQESNPRPSDHLVTSNFV